MCWIQVRDELHGIIATQGDNTSYSFMHFTCISLTSSICTTSCVFYITLGRTSAAINQGRKWNPRDSYGRYFKISETYPSNQGMTVRRVWLFQETIIAGH